MYSTVKELHIGIDIALQRINSASKQVIKPQEKDWVLNEVMFQLINNVIDPNPRIDRGYFEYSQKAIDMLQNIKVNNSKPYVLLNNDIHTFHNSNFIRLPNNYFRMIKMFAIIGGEPDGANIPIDKYFVDFKKATDIAHYTSEFTISLGSYTLFDVTALPTTIPTFNNDESKFMLVPIILETLNAIEGITANWVHIGDTYKTNNFIIEVDEGKIDFAFDPLSDKLIFRLGTINDEYSVAESDSYDDYSKGELVQCRIVKSDEESDITNHYFAKSIPNSPVVTIGNDNVKFNIPDGIQLNAIVPEYYRKPKFINSVLGTSCEISSIDFLNELVNQAAQKISARIEDKSYPNIINENLLLS